MKRQYWVALSAVFLFIVGTLSACSDVNKDSADGTETNSDNTSAEVVAASDSIIPDLTPVADLADAPADDVHVTYAPEVPPPSGDRDQQIFDLELEIVESTCEIDPANGVKTLMWGFRIAGDEDVLCGAPGPVLRGRVGDVARIKVTNLATNAMAHNIDFHSVTGQGGGAEATIVAPGETASIEARLLYPGAFMYHCAFGDVPEHIAKGMSGMFIVDPEQPLPEVDHEWAIMQSEWYVSEPDDSGEATFDREALTAEEPRYVTFNGRTNALTDDNALQMKVGERSRFYMVNEGLNLPSNFHPIGSHWDVVYPEAATHASNRVIRGSQSTLVVAGGGTVTELVGYVPSKIILVDHALVRTFYKGAIGQVVISGKPDPEIFVGHPVETDGADEGSTTTMGDMGSSTTMADGAAGSTTTALDGTTTTEAGASTASGAKASVSITPEAYLPDNADKAYSPLNIEVSVGTEVTWTNDDEIVHTVTSGKSDGRVGTPDDLFDSGNLDAGDTFSYTFDKPGTYDYYCIPHPWMKGTVTVK